MPKKMKITGLKKTGDGQIEGFDVIRDAYGLPADASDESVFLSLISKHLDELEEAAFEIRDLFEDAVDGDRDAFDAKIQNWYHSVADAQSPRELFEVLVESGAIVCMREVIAAAISLGFLNRCYRSWKISQVAEQN